MRLFSLLATLVLVCVALAFQGQAESDEEKERVAVERFLTVVERNPRRGTAFDRVYGFHVERGTLDTWLKKYRDRTAQDPKDGASWMIIGLVEAQRGKDAAAVQALQKAEAARPDDPLASFYLGQVLVLVGQPDKAAEALERAITRKPARTDLLDIFQALGRVYQRSQNVDQALKVWQRLEQLFPEDQRVREQIAMVLVDEGQFTQALPRLEALAKAATDPYRKVTFQMEAAELKLRLGQQDKALADLEAILANLEPESWLFRDARRRIEEAFLRSDDQAGLAKYYEAWLVKHADDVDAMGRLARTLSTLGRSPDARKWLDTALQKAPSRKDLRANLIELLTFEQKYAEAAKQYEALDQAEPNNPDVLREWGKLLLSDKSRPEAERKQAATAVWKRLIDRRPNDALTATQVADLYRQANLQAETLALYRQAVELAPESGQYREYLGEYLHSLKKTDEAKEVWRGMAEGKLKSAKNLARLAEVLASFNYPEEALTTLGTAAGMDKTDFGLQLRYAEMLTQNEKYDESVKQLTHVSTLAKNDEEREAVITGRIRCYQGQDKLVAVAVDLTQRLQAKGEATQWHELARFREALREMPEAVKASKQAVALAPKEIPYLTTLARLQEGGGELLAAAESYRQLAALDRKNKPEHLTNVAKLESRLGRTEPAMTAAKDLLAAAPGNPDHFKFFADLCFQLGNEDEGLEALRRAVRANPGEPNVLNNLAQALSERFRTGEAIELYWRAFAKANDVDARNGIVARLTDLYLQTNQFDKLLERLERERREPGRQRDFTFCVAQAHQSAGDFGAARRELESLLNQNARDSVILAQLAKLAEDENDDHAAVKYLRQLAQAAPAKDVEDRLAKALDRAGMGEEAQAIWSKVALAEQEPIKILAAIDRMLQSEKPEVALETLGRVRREGSATWEALYREGLALVQLKRTAEAEARFRSLLNLKHPEDELSMAYAAQLARMAKAQGVQSRTTTSRATNLAASRNSAVYQIRMTVGLDARDYYGPSNNPRAWVPTDFGSARIAALGWLLSLAQKAKADEAFLKTYRQAFETAAKQVAPEPQSLWNWYYLAMLRNEDKEQLRVVEQLAKLTDANAMMTVVQRYSTQRQMEANRRSQQTGKVAPKTADLDRAYRSFQRLAQLQPEWALTYTTLMLTDLRLVQRNDEATSIYRTLQGKASKPEELTQLMNVAAAEGDLPVVLQTADRIRKLPGRAASAYYALGNLGNAFAQAQGKLAEAKNLAGIQKLIDYQLKLWCEDRKDPAMVKRARSYRISPGGGPMNYPLMVGKGTSSSGRGSRYVPIDYPEANQFLDYNCILVLRNGYEAYKEADLVSDLVGAVTKQRDQAPAQDQAVYTMALSSLAWWGDDKPLALQQLTTVAQANANNVELQLDIADLHARLRNYDEALAIVDAVMPLDQQSTVRKEELALSLAQRLGSLERARQAAQRLFGLRLDAEAQARLAKTMQALGMHDLAEAVLARARRQAGSRTTALTSLMSQYATQGKNDVALQIAYQILRKSPPPTRTNYYNQNDEQLRAARSQAIGVLSRSGKLNELITRTEAQLKTAPSSTALWQTLIEYYQTAGQRDKAREAIEKLATLRPEDAQLRMQVAQHYQQADDQAKACDHYLAAFKKEPRLFAQRYWEIQQVFMQGNQTDKLIQFLDEVDLKALGQSYYVADLIQNQLRDEKTREAGMRLFKRAWTAFKDQRQYLINNLHDPSLRNLPELCDYVLDGLLPEKDTAQNDPWGLTGQVLSYYEDGRIISYVSRCVEMATEQGRLDELVKRVDDALAAQPKWHGGRAIKAVLLARAGQPEDATKLIEQLLANKDEPAPLNVRRILAQELESVAAVRPLAIKLYESCKGEGIEGWGANPQLDATNRLAGLLVNEGRKTEAREMLLKLARSPSEYYGSNQEYADYQTIQRLWQSAQRLDGMGFHVDAVKLYSELLSDPQRLENSQNYFGRNMKASFRQALSTTLDRLQGDTLLTALDELLAPTADPKTTLSGGVKPSVLDLVPMVQAYELDKASFTSIVASALTSAGGQENSLRQVREKLTALKKNHPDDYSVAIALTLCELGTSKPGQATSETAAKAVRELLTFAEAHPLEALPAGTKTNARHRAEAGKQVILWLVARPCLERSDLQEVGAQLATRALVAAQRMNSEEHQLAILKEWGHLEIKQGKKAQGDARWRSMLGMILTPPPPGTRRTTASGAPTKAVTTRVAGPNAEPAEPQDPPPAVKAAPGKVQRGPVTQSRVPVVTKEQAARALDLAKLAAEEGLFDLSTHATQRALQAGTPVDLGTNINPRSSRMVVMNTGEEIVEGGPDYLVRLQELSELWAKKGAPADKVYLALCDTVLPPSRPGEVFLYSSPVSTYLRTRRGVSYSYESTSHHTLYVRSGSSLLASWAVKAGQADALRKLLAERQDQPQAQLNVRIVQAQLAAAANSPDGNAALTWIKDQLAKDNLQNTADLACHAAMPALKVKALHAQALVVLEAATKSYVNRNPGAGPTEPGMSLMLFLAEHYFTQVKDTEKGKKYVADYLKAAETPGRNHDPDSWNHQRRQYLLKAARLYAEAGIADAALDLAGQFVDLGSKKTRYYYGDPGDITAVLQKLIRHLNTLPAAQRYAMLKTWTLPTTDRKTVRCLATFVPYTDVPHSFGTPTAHPDGLVSTAELLVTAATEVGKLDELSQAVDSAVQDKAEQAYALALLLRIARKDPTAAAGVTEHLEALRKEEPKDENERYQRQQRGNWIEHVLFAASVKYPALDKASMELLDWLQQQTNPYGNPELTGRLALARHTIVARRTLGAAVKLPDDPGLVHWRRADSLGIGTLGKLPTRWAAYGGLVTHAGGDDANLILKVPLAGSFDVTGEVAFSASSEMSMGYGGMHFLPFQSQGSSMVTNVGNHDSKLVPEVHQHQFFAKTEGFIPFRLEVRPQSIKYYINNRYFWEEKEPSTNSPWVALYSRRELRAACRNLKLTGQPVIPKEVKLLEGSRLEGWVTSLFNETQPPRRSIGTQSQYWDNESQSYQEIKKPDDLSAFDWSASDGALRGRRLTGESLTRQPSWIGYHRPLHSGDSVNYEFRYDPAQQLEVHPTLGRVVFLLDPQGIKLLWLDSELQGSKSNPLRIAEEVRHALPLKAGEWNSMTILYGVDRVSLSLNGQPILNRKLEPGVGSTFGLFHWKEDNAAEVRHLVLHGGWDTTPLTGDLLATTARSPDVDNAHAFLVDEEFHELNLPAVLKHVKVLAPAERYRILRDWVLPKTGPVARLYFTFPSNHELPEPATKPTSEVLCPALELIEVAKTTNQLPLLAAEVNRLTAKTSHDQRCQAAMRFLLALAQGRDQDKAWDALAQLTSKLEPRSTARERFPELLACRAALSQPALRDKADKLLESLVISLQENSKKKITFAEQPEWERLLRYEQGRAKLLLAGDARPVQGDRLWTEVSQSTAATRARGIVPAVWTVRGDTFTHYPGLDSMIYYHQPLRGDFTVECELSSAEGREAQLLYAGQRVVPHRDLKKYTLFNFSRTERAGTFLPPLKALPEWYPFKLLIKGGALTTFIGDRKVYETRLAADADPWLAVYCDANQLGGMRKFRLTGAPTVPETIDLGKATTLSGWLTDYYSEHILQGAREEVVHYRGGTQPMIGWEKKGDEIVGTKWTKDGLPRVESVLRYHRPLLEYGQLDYEFFHEPGKTLTHPALDRLVFLLDKEGVKIHWLTHGSWQIGGPAPDNAVVEPETRRGNGPLPLKANAWNQMTLVLKGDRVTVRLNGQDIAQRQLDAGNSRHFGLFHYADETQVRVRHLKYRGDWSRQASGPVTAK